MANVSNKKAHYHYHFTNILWPKNSNKMETLKNYSHNAPENVKMMIKKNF